MAKNYINNKSFYNALVEWEDDGYPRPIPDYIALCFHEIANRRGRKWYRHTALEEMKGEAVVQCIKKAHKFDRNYPTQNPFAYFSQIVQNAFQQIMNQERKLADHKFEVIRDNTKDSEKYDWGVEHYSNVDEDNNYVDRESERIEKHEEFKKQRKVRSYIDEHS